MDKLIVSPAPHIVTEDSVRRRMLLVILSLLPAWVVSLFAFGISVFYTTLISICACVLFEWLISVYFLKRQSSICDCSAILTGLLLAFNLPSTLDWWIVVIGALVAIGVGKMTFGGLGQNVFNPALVGRVFLLLSFPAQMTTWPLPIGFKQSYLDATTGATPLSVLKNCLHEGGESFVNQLPSVWDAFVGKLGGSFGEVSAIALILGGCFLIVTKVISWHIPTSILLTVVLFSCIIGWCGVLPAGLDTWTYVGHNLFTGGLLLGAFFMATDYVTSPMIGTGKIIFGIGIGLTVMVIRLWGAYPEGMSFAILIMNATVPLLNKIRPRRFGIK